MTSIALTCDLQENFSAERAMLASQSVSLNLVLCSVPTSHVLENKQFIYDDFICSGFSHDNPKVKPILSLRNMSWKLVPESLFPFSFLSMEILAVFPIPAPPNCSQKQLSK